MKFGYLILSATGRSVIRRVLEKKETPKGQCFSKADRLLKRRQFVYLVDNGKKLQNQYFIAFFTCNELERCRLGITVSKRVGKAVTRNRIKRLVRQGFRQQRSMFKRCWDIHLIAKKNAANGSAHNTVTALEQIFRRIESMHNG